MVKDEFDELEDFEIQKPRYVVCLLGYDEEDNITDFDKELFSSSDAELAYDFAKKYVEEERYKNEILPEEIATLEVLVETVVDIDGCDQNVGTLFDEYIEIEEI